MLFSFFSCQRKIVNYDNGKIVFYSKSNKTKFILSEHESNCIANVKILNSFIDSIPEIINKENKLKQATLSIRPLFKDSLNCNGIFIYKIYSGNISRKYSYEGDVYNIFSIIDQKVIFFDDNKDKNILRVAYLKMYIPSQIIEMYNDNMVNNEISR